jgi:hypothetical protein
MIQDSRLVGDCDIHGTYPVALFTVDARGGIALDFKNTKQVKKAEEGAVGTNVFAEGTLNEKREEEGSDEDDQSPNGELAAPKVEERGERVDTVEHEFR